MISFFWFEQTAVKVVLMVKALFDFNKIKVLMLGILAPVGWIVFIERVVVNISWDRTNDSKFWVTHSSEHY